MKNQRYFFLVLIFILCIISISAVSAATDSASDIVSANDDQMLILDESIDDDVSTSINDDELILEENNANALDSKSNIETTNIDEKNSQCGDNEILTAPNAKNFTDLNRTINGNNNATIYLNDEFTYDSSYDSILIEGININRTVTIEGNHHTINGNNEARMFHIQSGGNVTIKNINFINGYCDEDFVHTGHYGGAVYCEGSFTAINCTFTSNKGYFGGAMYDGVAINCTFTSNSGVTGGAIYNGVAINCTFTGNTAESGAAMKFGYQILCNQLDENAYDETTTITPKLSVEYDIFKPHSSEKLTFYLTYELDGIVYSLDGYNTSINLTQNGNNLGTYYALSGEDGGWIVDRDYGLYNLTFSIKNTPFEPVITIKVPEDSSFSALSRIIKDNNGNEITLNKTYTYNPTYDYDLKDGIIIDHAVTINGNNHTINGLHEARIFNITGPDVTINNITFINGYVKKIDTIDEEDYSKGHGGAINCIGDRCTIKNSKFINNTAVYGGAVYMNSNNSSISYSEFYNNTVMTDTKSHVGGGAVHWYGHNGNISYSTFIDNHAIGYGAEGGAIRWYTSHNGTLTDSKFINNTANYLGGGILWMGGNGTIKNSNFTNNTVDNTGYGTGGAGGGAYVVFYSNTTIKDSNFTNNSAEDGGAIGWYNTTYGTISNITFMDNEASRDGGAICWAHSSNGNICNSTFTNNNANRGGAIYCDPNHDVTLANSTFTNNTAKEGGAVIWSNNYNSAAYNLTFTNNTAINGSAIYWFSYSGYLRNSTFIHNNATNGTLWYGSSHNSNITDLTFINNTAAKGASIAAYYSNNVNVTKSIFINNTATEGAVFYWYNSTGVNLNNNVILNNPDNEFYFYKTTVYNISDNWFGNNATTYADKPNEFCNSWLFLNATADPNPAAISDPTEIVFKLYAYDGTDISDHDNTLLPAINLTITPTNGTADKEGADLEENITFTPTVSGTGSVTAKMEDAEYTIVFDVKHSPNLSYVSQEVTYNGTTAISITYNDSATGKVNVKLEGANSNYNFEDMDLNTTIQLGDIEVDVYDVTIEYLGDEQFAKSTVTGTLTVKKIETAITPANATITLLFEDVSKVGYSLSPSDAVGDISFTSSAPNVVSVDSATGDINAIGIGSANITINFSGSQHYATSNATVEVTVNPASSSVNAKDVTITYGEAISIQVTSENASDVSYEIFDKDGVKVNDGTIEANGNISGFDLPAGEYTVNLKTEVDGNHVSVNNTSKLTINKAQSTISAKDVSVNYGDTVTIEVSSVNATELNYQIKDGNNKTVANGTIEANGNITVNKLAAGKYTAEISYSGNENYTGSKATAKITVNKFNTKLTASEVTTTYNVKKNLVITLKDNLGKALSGLKITVNLGTAKKYTTDKNGQVKVAIASLVPKTYTAKISFAGNYKFKASSTTAKVTVKKASPKITAKAKTFKFEDKTKKYTITLKDNKGKVMKNTKVTLKVGGKTYTAKTNSKGVATFKLTKLTKKGSFNAVITYAGNKYYKKLTKKAKITVKAPAWKTVAKGSKDKAMVKKIQRALKNNGHYLSYKGRYLKVDGIFEKYTEMAVKEFQKDKKLKVTGKVDYATAKKLKIVS
ncbi:MAG: peptidoglycan-binding protein [Methanobrevibacter sp.]|nr:peptidoglycan-binding protein [Methanobrevibacter sp.]